MADPIVAPDEPSQEFLNEHYDGYQLVTAAVVLIVVTTLFVGLRFWSDKRRVARWFPDDILIGVSYVLYMMQCGVMIAMDKAGGAGRHIVALERQDPQALERWKHLVLVYLLILYFVLVLPRLSILWLYLRVFNWRRGVLERTVTLILMGLFAVSLVLLVVFTVAMCRPVGFRGKYTVTSGHCGRFHYYFRTQMFLGIVMDFVILVLPWRTIWALKIPVSDRMTVALFFFMASFGVIIWTIVRVVVSYQNTYWVDGTYTGVSLSVWYSVEAGYYIMANCLSRIRPLLLFLLPKSFIKLWRTSMTSLGGLLRAPHFVLRDHHPSRKDTTTSTQPRKTNDVAHRKWDAEALGEIEGVQTKMVTGRLVSMSFMDDPYMLGHNSKLVGVSSWSIVRGPGPVSPEPSRAGDREIQVTVEVSTSTNIRPLGWTS